jgi:hypothetical protein
MEMRGRKNWMLTGQAEFARKFCIHKIDHVKNGRVNKLIDKKNAAKPAKPLSSEKYSGGKFALYRLDTTAPAARLIRMAVSTPPTA